MRTPLLLLAMLAATACNGTSSDPDPIPNDSPAAAAEGENDALPDVFPHSMKGYALYGYVRGGRTYFTLVTGTNRLKTFEELDDAQPRITDDGRIRVRAEGIAGAEDLLRRLPPGEFAMIETVRHVSVAQNTVPDDIGEPPDAVLAALDSNR